VLVATANGTVLVLRPLPPGVHGDGFAPAEPLATVLLTPDEYGGRPLDARPIALAAGYLDPEPTEKVKAPRKQVLAVVTASLHVFCFDHNLKLMWRTAMRDELPPRASVREVALLITAHRVRQYDRGMVIVGASLATGDLANADGLAAGGDALAAELAAEGDAARHAHSANGSDPLEDVHAGQGLAGGEADRHFSYYAYDGTYGYERWRHDARSFHKDLAELADAEHSLDTAHRAGPRAGGAAAGRIRRARAPAAADAAAHAGAAAAGDDAVRVGRAGAASHHGRHAAEPSVAGGAARGRSERAGAHAARLRGARVVAGDGSAIGGGACAFRCNAGPHPCCCRPAPAAGALLHAARLHS
jgi:hypothetical protein